MNLMLDFTREAIGQNPDISENLCLGWIIFLNVLSTSLFQK